MKSWMWAVLAIVVVIILGYLGRHQIKSMLGGSSTPATTEVSSSAPTPTVSESASPSEASTSANMQQVMVEGNEFKFTPSTISVKMNQPVEITFKNTGKFPHNLTIKGLNIATKTVQPGQEDSVTFTPAKAGSFEYMCTVDSHAEKGMTGTLTVQ